MSKPRETDLYPPVKALLERQGFCVKGEVADADVAARRGDDPPIIVELKTGFSLALVHQGIARLAITDAVYVCVPRRTGRTAWRSLKENVRLCRRLGLGVITVRMTDGLVEVHCDPGPYAPRKSKARQGRLLREFARRRGDPAQGGAIRSGQVTAYRQDAILIAGHLEIAGPTKGAVVARATGVVKATKIMRDDHYGWFARLGPGVYQLTEAGRSALAQYRLMPITPQHSVTAPRSVAQPEHP